MKKALFLTVILSLLFLVSPAFAAGPVIYDDFNDGVMDTSLWDLISEGYPEYGSSALMTSEFPNSADGAFNAYTTGGAEAFDGYASTWKLSTQAAGGFNYSLDYYLNKGSDGMEMQTGLYVLTGDGVETVGIGAGFQGSMWSYSTDSSIYGTSGWGYRPGAQGQFEVDYNNEDDLLVLRAQERTDESSPWQTVFAAEYEGLRLEEGISEVGVWLGGNTDGSKAVPVGYAMLDNFKLTRGTVTPEPVGSILFLAGGAVIGLARMRKKKR